jgi:hypothetical protein
MTKQTSNHGWTIPTVDQTTNWGTVLNDFFDNALDEDVPLRNALANRPSAGSSAPALFVSTDETPPRLYYNDGATWTQVGGSGTQLSEEGVDDGETRTISGVITGLTRDVKGGDAIEDVTISADDGDYRLFLYEVSQSSPPENKPLYHVEKEPRVNEVYVEFVSNVAVV